MARGAAQPAAVTVRRIAAAAVTTTVLDVHDSAVEPWVGAMCSGQAGTVFLSDPHGDPAAFWAPSRMAVGRTRLVADHLGWGVHRPVLSGSLLGIPRGEHRDGLERVSEVLHCRVEGASLSASTTMTIAPDKAYLTTVPLGVLLLDIPTGALEVHAPGGLSVTVARIPSSWVMDASMQTTFSATSDGESAVVILGGSAFFTRLAALGHRAPEAVFIGRPHGAALTTSYVVGWQNTGSGPVVRRIPRSRAGSAGTFGTWPLVWGGHDSMSSITELAAGDRAVAFVLADSRGASVAYCVRAGSPGCEPVAYPRPVQSVCTFEDTDDFLVADLTASAAGLYRWTPGDGDGCRATGLEPRWARTEALALSHGRAIYSDDSTAELPVYLREVPSAASPGVEVRLAEASLGIGVSVGGPFVAFATPVPDGPLGAGARRIAFGRLGSRLRCLDLPATDVRRLELSGHRLLVTGGLQSWLVDVLSGRRRRLGAVGAALWGDHLATVEYATARLVWRDLAAHSSQVILPGLAQPPAWCVDNELWSLAIWGQSLAYSFRCHVPDPNTVVAGRFDAVSGHTCALPAPAAEVYDLAHGDGLLLSAAASGVAAWDLRETPPARTDLDATGEPPLALDGRVAAWRAGTHRRAVVKDLQDDDALPSLAPAEPRHLGAWVTTSGASATGCWRALHYVTRDVDWTIDITCAGSTTLRRLAGTSSLGEISASWDGTGRDGRPLPAGTYGWALRGTAADGATLADRKGRGPVAAAGTVRVG